ncbi:MAG: aspartyl/asparaginyl beta-hydroxylase-like dioxygenase [Acidimicrobiales bacterium]|nr:aspartyl/asparaginyl beta-hydroxylase-like dioxygenase [Acidimicrobiales bacterium]
MDLAERVLGPVVEANNERARRRARDRDEPNPRRLGPDHWSARLEAAHPAIRAEWDAFAASNRLPHIADLISEDQGNEGAWRAGLLVSRGRPIALAARFPATMAALADVGGLWSALWSVLEPGTELPTHDGPNAGVLRYHLGVDCGTDSALEVAGHVTPYRDGRGILFDDTALHAAWNRGDRPRVTLFCEVLRPLPQPAATINRAVQRLLSLDPRYRQAPARALEWDRALNGPAERG